MAEGDPARPDTPAVTRRPDPVPGARPDGPVSDRLPTGFAVRLSPLTQTRDGGRLLVGGDAGTVLQVKLAASRLVEPDGVVRVRDASSATLARVLLDKGFAVPRWADDVGDDRGVRDVTVVVPVRDRPSQLRRLLTQLPAGVPVIVVDDGSADPPACAAASRAAGARLLVHRASRGPAAARNTGLAAVATPFVAFVDSDVQPEPGWLAGLRRHFDDPAVALVGPRVLGVPTGPDESWLARYEAARSSLDLGPVPGGVRPRARVSYLPGACLVARTTALGDGFDEDMRVAEDVDLAWRLAAAGWRVRYDPGCVVRHEHRTTMSAWLRRKAFYGTGAGPLATRHGAAVAPLVLTSWTGAVAGALVAQRRWSVPVAAAVHIGLVVRLRGRLRHGGRPTATAAHLADLGVRAALRQTASALVRHYWPVAVPAALALPRVRRALLVAAVVEAELDRRATGADLDPVRYLVARRFDDLAYGAGVWFGALRERSPRALLPVVHGVRIPHRDRARPES